MKKIVKKKTSPTPEGADGSAAPEKKRIVRKVSGQAASTKSLKKDPKEEEKERENSKTPDVVTSRYCISSQDLKIP